MGNAGKKSNAFAKHVMWPFGGSRELAQIFFFIVLTLNMCPVHLLNLDTINTSEIVWESGREFKFIR